MKLEAVKKWNNRHALIVLLAGTLTVFTHLLSILILTALLSFCTFTFLKLKESRFPGYANMTTLFRLSLLFLLGFFLFQLSPWLIASVALIILALDGVDGYLARRFKESSDFGAYLDMETDTFYVCLFCTFYYLNHQLGSWVLLVGYARYLYVGLILVFRLQAKKEKSTRFAKTIAVTLFTALLLPLVSAPNIYKPAMILAAILVIYSFGLSFWGLWTDDK